MTYAATKSLRARRSPVLLASWLTVLGAAATFLAPLAAASASPAGAVSAAVVSASIVAAAGRPGPGWWTVAADGAVAGRDGAPEFGSMAGTPLNQPMVGMSSTATGNGYWAVAQDGGIFTFGDAGFYGSTGSMRLNKPVFSMAPTASNRGYWLVASDGGIFSFGDARFLGSGGAMGLTSPVVGMLTTPSGNGYWLIGQDGRILNFGDAQAFPSVPTCGCYAHYVIAAARTPSGKGLWIARANGTVATVGDAGFFGDSPGFATLTVGLAAASDGSRYWLVSSGGQTASYAKPAYTMPAYPSDVRQVYISTPTYLDVNLSGTDPYVYEAQVKGYVQAAGWTITSTNEDHCCGFGFTATYPGYKLQAGVSQPNGGHNGTVDVIYRIDAA